MKEQLKLWRDANKKEQWHDAPAKAKVIPKSTNKISILWFCFAFRAISKIKKKISQNFLIFISCVKVEIRNDMEWGLCHMHIEITLRLSPQAAYDVLTNPDNQPYSRVINDRELLVYFSFTYRCMIQISITIKIFKRFISKTKLQNNI